VASDENKTAQTRVFVGLRLLNLGSSYNSLFNAACLRYTLWSWNGWSANVGGVLRTAIVIGQLSPRVAALERASHILGGNFRICPRNGE